MLLWPEKSSASFYWPLAAAAAPPIMPATSRRLAACSSRGLLAVTLALLSGGFQLAVAFRVDFLLTPRQHVLRRDVAGGTVQADVVVMLHVALDQTPRIFQRQRRARANALPFEMPDNALRLDELTFPVTDKPGVLYSCALISRFGSLAAAK